MRMGYWILNENKEPIAVDDVMTCARFLEDFENNVVDQTRLETVEGKKLLVSTVFLGLDHQFGADGPPLLFESMTFGGGSFGNELAMERYPTYAEAKSGHERMVEMVKRMLELESKQISIQHSKESP